jgi:hypothetical protein
MQHVRSRFHFERANDNHSDFKKLRLAAEAIMSTRLTIICALVIAGFVVDPRAGDAQQSPRVGSDSAIPKELAIALLGGGRVPGQPPPEIFVGRAPNDFPTSLLPAGSVEILGGIRYSDTPTPRGNRGAAIFILRSNPDSALPAIYAAWERAGWKHPDLSQSRGGFVPAPITRPTFYCSDSGFVTTVASARPAGGRYLRIDFSGAQPFGPCDRRDPYVRPPNLEAYSFPTLVAPAGVTTSNSSLGQSSIGREAMAVLETELTPAQILAHYASQLKSAGWTVGEPATTANAAFQIAEMKDLKGGTLTGILAAIAIPKPKAREVSFRVIAP